MTCAPWRHLAPHPCPSTRVLKVLFTDLFLRTVLTQICPWPYGFRMLALSYFYTSEEGFWLRHKLVTFAGPLSDSRDLGKIAAVQSEQSTASSGIQKIGLHPGLISTALTTQSRSHYGSFCDTHLSALPYSSYPPCLIPTFYKPFPVFFLPLGLPRRLSPQSTVEPAQLSLED